MVQAVDITEEMVMRAARALDRQALIAQGWAAPAIQRVMAEVKRPADVSIKTAETVLFAAFVGTPLNEEPDDA